MQKNVQIKSIKKENLAPVANIQASSSAALLITKHIELAITTYCITILFR